MKKIKINNRGFTLVEMILTLALLFVIIGLTYSIYFTGNKSFKVNRDIGFAQQDARLISEFLNKELKYSSTMSKDNYQEGRYFSIELGDSSDGTKILIKTEYENDVLIKETKLLSRDWKDIGIELEQQNRIISGLITIKLGNNTDYKLPITIPLENINTNSELESSVTLSDINKVYYALPEDILVASAEDEEYNPGDGENEGNENGESENDENGGNEGEQNNGNGENNSGNLGYPEWKDGDVYNIGDIVSYNNKDYIKRTSWGNDLRPGTNYQVWFELSEQWLSYNIYLEGDIVMYGGKKYISKYWNENVIPGDANNAWELL